MFLQRLMSKDVARYISLLCGASVLVFSVVSMSYWHWINWGGVGFFGSLTFMKFNTALSFFLSAIAFLLSRSEHNNKLLRIIRYTCAALVFLIGAWTFLEYLHLTPFLIDQWFCRDTTIGIQHYPGRMSPNTAMAFVVVGGLLFIINPQQPRHFRLIHLLTWVVMTIAVFSLVGYLFGTEALYGISQATRMSPWTSLCLILLSLGILMLYPEHGLLADFASTDLSGRLLRQLLPTAVIAPLFLEWLQVEGMNAGFYDQAYGNVLMSLLMSMLFIALILWSSRSIRRLEAERRLAITQTALSEARLKSILDNTPAVIFIKDENARYILVNRQYEVLFHIRSEDMAGKTDYDVFPRDHAERYIADDRNVLKTRNAMQIEEAVPQDDGMHTFITTKFPMWDPVRNQHVICGIATDITLRKQAEEKMAEAVKVKSEFTSMVSHELRSPLTVIKGAIEIVGDEVAGPLTADQKKHLEMALHNVDRLNRLITDVLDYQRVEGGRISYQVEPHDVSSVISDTLEGFRTVVGGKGLQFRVDIPKGLPQVLCDPDALIQVVTNLLNNAVKFTNAGSIKVYAKKHDDAVEIGVEDTGFGIAKEDQGRLFHSFSRIGNHGREIGGTGLGLAICRKIVERLGGTIAVKSSPGVGSTFYFTLPLAHPKEVS